MYGHTVGSGLNNNVNALSVFNNLLIAGGEFTGHISRWDGNDWNILGGGVESNVWTIINYQNSIIARW